MGANQTRILSVSESIADLGYEGIVAFDREEPEYEAFTNLHEAFNSEQHLALLGIYAGTQDYQLAGDAQRFWSELEQVALAYGQLESIQDVRDILGTFMEADVNARLNSQKRDRLIRMFENGFGEWFIDTYGTVTPLKVWEEVATALETKMKRKTVVFSMKVYDIVNLIVSGEYLDFPKDIPIPCDLQVERVASKAGLVEEESEDSVMSSWADVAEQVSSELGETVSLLRIDSIVWQAGQIIGEHEPNRGASRTALVDHFEEVGLDPDEATVLADELTAEM